LILNSEISIALKNYCGKFDLIDFSIFEIGKINSRLELLKVNLVNHNVLLFKIKCPVCGNKHYYRYSICEFLKREILIGGCEVYGTPLFYIGNNEKIIKKVNIYNKVISEDIKLFINEIK
jgi:hypothetical protein